MALSIKANKVSDLPALLDYRRKQEIKVQHLEALNQMGDEHGLHEHQRDLKCRTRTVVSEQRWVTRRSPVRPGDLKGQAPNDVHHRKKAPQSSDLTNRQASPGKLAALHEQVFLFPHRGRGNSCQSEDTRPIPLQIWLGSHSPAVSHSHDAEPF